MGTENSRDLREAKLLRREDAVSDEDLVIRAVDGDHWAEDVLFRRFAPEIARTVERLLGSSADADDIVQETFLAALDELSDLRDPRAFRGWVLQIAVRKTHRRFRRRKLMRLLGLDRSVPDRTLELIAAPGLDADQRAELALIDARLSRLPIQLRTAWTLRYVDGRPLGEVALACSCSLATAKRWIAKAQQQIGRNGGSDGDSPT